MSQNLTQTQAFARLAELAARPVSLKDSLNAQRIKEYVRHNGPLEFSFATALVDTPVLDALQKLSDEQDVIGKYKRLLAGDLVNVGEKRKVLHHQTRSLSDRGMYGEEQQKIAAFCEKVHSKQLIGYTGKPFTHVVQIGIGGSDLGPRAMYIALERHVKSLKGTLPLTASFIANVDPDDANHVLSSVDFETTLFIVVSKSGTTQETLTNLAFVKQRAKDSGLTDVDLKKHFIAVTGKGSPMDDPSAYLASFYIDDNIGGRYSSTSAVGGAVLSLAFGADVFESFLQGAGVMDQCALDPNIYGNIALLSALIGLWERNFLGFSSKGVIPYCEALSRFPAHLQQLDCESNGKRVNMAFDAIDYETGPVIFGEPGTNGQHSFFQKLHQGTDVIPLQFIAFKKPQIASDITTFGSSSQDKLIANLVAQMVALAVGKDDVNLNKQFPGNRPSTLLIAEQLTPAVLGALLAFYENVVMFQGFLWNINSFDQEGVQLGKVLTQQLLADSSDRDPVLVALQSLIKD